MSNYREDTVLANTQKTLLDRIEIDGEVALEAAITSVKTRVFQYATYEDAVSDTDGTEMGTVITTLAADCWFDTLQRDGMWDNRDRLGYNCRIDVPGARFPAGDRYYRIEQVIDQAVGEDFSLRPWILYALPSAID